MSENKATRLAYGEALCELGEAHSDVIVLDADLSGATMTNLFRQKYPDRHINCGIAESDMISVAGGLSTTGFVPFASSFAMFAAGRAFEQVRNTIGYPHLNVKICATHAGISVGEDGASHQCCEDIALMRSIPGMTVIVPSDAAETAAAINAAYDFDGPVYLRFSRFASRVFNDNPDYHFEIGKGILLRPGKDITIVATGLMVAEAMDAAEALAAEGIDARVINIHTIKPLDEELILNAAIETGGIITVEEHSIIGGLGDAVASLLSEKHPTRLRRIGIMDEFGHSGPAAKLLKQFGLSSENIAAVTKDFLKR